MQLALQVHDHVVHFYHLHALDWVDVVSAISADPKATSALAQSVSDWPLSSPGYFKDIQGRLKKFVESGQLGPFKNGYWGSKAYKLPPEANLMAVAHYLEALDFQKEIVKIHTIFGGKNPHPNWLVGGVPCPINVDGVGAVGAINMERLNYITSIIDQIIEFNDKVYIPDIMAIGSFYKDWLYGVACRARTCSPMATCRNMPMTIRKPASSCPRGAIINGNLKEFFPVDHTDPEQIQEYVTHSWYKYPDESKGLHPWAASPSRITNSARRPRARRRISNSSTRTANIPGSRLRAGAAMPWKSARSPAGSSAMRRARPSSRSRSTRC